MGLVFTDYETFPNVNTDVTPPAFVLIIHALWELLATAVP